VIDAQKFEQILLARKNELDNRLQHIEHDLDQPMTNDIEDRATEREDDEVMETMGNSGLVELEAIDSAIERIKADTFGVCVDCGDAISTERLDIMPTATKCRKCM